MYKCVWWIRRRWNLHVQVTLVWLTIAFTCVSCWVWGLSLRPRNHAAPNVKDQHTTQKRIEVELSSVKLHWVCTYICIYIYIVKHHYTLSCGEMNKYKRMMRLMLVLVLVMGMKSRREDEGGEKEEMFHHELKFKIFSYSGIPRPSGWDKTQACGRTCRLAHDTNEIAHVLRRQEIRHYYAVPWLEAKGVESGISLLTSVYSVEYFIVSSISMLHIPTRALRVHSVHVHTILTSSLASAVCVLHSTYTYSLSYSHETSRKRDFKEPVTFASDALQGGTGSQHGYRVFTVLKTLAHPPQKSSSGI